MCCSGSEPDWLWLYHLKTTTTKCELLGIYNVGYNCRVSHLQLGADCFYTPKCWSRIQSLGDKGSPHNTLSESIFHSLIVGAASTSCSGWMVQDSDCLCNGSEACGGKKSILHSKTLFSVKCSKTFFHHIQLTKSPLKRVCGTFNVGSATLIAGPWGPFTGSTSRDTLPFAKALEINTTRGYQKAAKCKQYTEFIHILLLPNDFCIINS